MAINIVVPEVGESVVDARVARWLKQPGDAVVVGEPLVELETDKVDVEVAAPQGGVLATIAHGNGADVKIGEVLGTITEGASAAASPRAAAAPNGTATSSVPTKPQSAAPAAPASSAVRRRESSSAPVATSAPVASPPAQMPPAESPEISPSSAASSRAAVSSVSSVSAGATPSARKLARERGAGPEAAPQVTNVSQSANVSQPVSAKVAPSARVPTTAPGPVSQREPHPSDGSEPVERIRMSKRRATIARRLVEVQQSAAMLTTFNEVDMSAVMALRERQKTTFKEQHGVGLGIASFFVKATIAALRETPRLNAEVQGDEMVLKHFYDIGVAVGAVEGLVVPVLRGADRLSFAEIESGIRSFAAKAADGTLAIDDLRGGTFTITNGGVFGSLMSTPILNPPQVGILGLHTIKDRPVAVGGQVVVRPMMYTALTYDHRIVDGAEAVRFLVRIKTLVEDPGALLIES